MCQQPYHSPHKCDLLIAGAMGTGTTLAAEMLTIPGDQMVITDCLVERANKPRLSVLRILFQYANIPNPSLPATITELCRDTAPPLLSAALRWWGMKAPRAQYVEAGEKLWDVQHRIHMVREPHAVFASVLRRYPGKVDLVHEALREFPRWQDTHVDVRVVKYTDLIEPGFRWPVWDDFDPNPPPGSQPIIGHYLGEVQRGFHPFGQITNKSLDRWQGPHKEEALRLAADYGDYYDRYGLQRPD